MRLKSLEGATRAVVIGVALASSILIAGCGFDDASSSDARDHAPNVRRTSAELLAAAGVVENLNVGSETVVHTHIAVPPADGAFVEPPGFCFFTAVRGGFGGDGDYAEIRPSLDGSYWDIVVSSATSYADGPSVDYGCVRFDQLSSWPREPHYFVGEYFEARLEGPPSGLGEPAVYNPEQLWGVGAEIPHYRDGINVLTKIGGSMLGFKRVHVATVGNFGGKLGNVGAEDARFYEHECNAHNDNVCRLTVGSYTFSNTQVPVRRSVADANRERHVLTALAAGEPLDPTLLLTNVDETFCFLSGVSGTLASASDSVTLGEDAGRWHLTSTVDAKTERLSFGAATCIPFLQP